MRYDPAVIQPFRDELTAIGFKELRSAEAVDRSLAEDKGTNLLVINSVCGCAAGRARPGIADALRRAAVRPDHLTTVFAGGDIEATQRVRERIGNIPPSSPSIALFRNGELVEFVPRYMIEKTSAGQISDQLVGIFEQHCRQVEAPARETK
jgi:putative YphP/YqiW family bacilliredoxin